MNEWKITVMGDWGRDEPLLAEADVIVVNTCGFIESAKTESIDTFFSLHEANPDARIVMAGCLAQRYGSEMELEEADAIFGNHDLSRFSDVLDSLGDKEVLIPEYPDPDREAPEDSCFSLPHSQFLSGSVFRRNPDDKKPL